jgi:beta-glucosidase/6-phospho-beta-glucosidase/beta-galactosidase
MTFFASSGLKALICKMEFTLFNKFCEKFVRYGVYMQDIRKLIMALLTLLSCGQLLAQSHDLVFPKSDQFFFGVSNAPSQVEDGLDDIWMQFARDGHIPAFDNYARPEERIGFWSDPEKEILFAKENKMEVFRLGVDWQRLFPKSGELDRQALEHYRKILKLIKANGMKVMLTLFHHTETHYTFRMGSWHNPKMIDEFRIFWQIVLNELGDDIDYLVTFNEGQIYVLMARVVGIWPHPTKPNALNLFNIGPFKGLYEKSLLNMAKSHREIYEYSKARKFKFQIGFAHNMANYDGKGLLSKIGIWMSWRKFNLKLADLLAPYLDFFGINYYGVEVLKGTTVGFDPKVEYSDSGRGIDPKGLYKILTRMHDRYNVKGKFRPKKAPKLPFIITENGIADELDWYRPLYIAEHLAAIHQAMKDGVKVLGYIQWTLTDNFEWADGYCPKFGLSAIDRETFERQPRGSLAIYKRLIETRTITGYERDTYFANLMSKTGQLRPMCRHEDGKTSLREPRWLPVGDIDWRFRL